MDWNVGRVLDALRAGPHDEDTIVIFFSDHGFHWGEKYHHAKSTLWEQGTEASMMVRVPGLTRDGAVCDQPVSLIDVFPTLVDLCRLDTPPQGLDGLSLRAAAGRRRHRGLDATGHHFPRTRQRLDTIDPLPLYPLRRRLGGTLRLPGRPA